MAVSIVVMLGKNK